MNTSKQQGRSPIYDSSLKIAVAKEYLTSPLGYGALAKKYGFKSASSVREMLRWYRKKYPEGLQHLPETTQNIGADTKTVSEASLKEATLKITALEMLIENASKELGVDLVKKFGSKQSKK
jgi:hypothetical protein